MMQRIFTLTLLFTVSICAAEEITLEDARRASVAAASTPETARCSGKFRVTQQETEDDEPVVWTDGTFKLVYAPGKLRLELEFIVERMKVVTVAADGTKSKPQVVDSPTDRVVILSDGRSMTKVTYTPRIRPTGCRIETYSTLRSAISFAKFPLRDPVRPHLSVLHIDKLIENLGPENVEWSPSEGTLYRGVYHAKNAPKVRAVFEVDRAIGNQLVAQSVYNLPAELPASSSVLKWGQVKDLWYVKQVDVTRRYAERPIRKEQVVFATFEPGVAVDDSEFDISSLRIPPNTRTFHR